MNRILLVGRLTRDPELKCSSDGSTSFVNFTMAITRYSKSNTTTNSFTGEVTETPATREADFIPIIAFGKTAEYICNKASKGSMVSVSGRLRIEGYQDKNGDRRFYTEVVADEFNCIGNKRTDDTASGL